MSVSNPYASPVVSDVLVSNSINEQFTNLSDKDLKKTYYRSANLCSLNFFVLVWVVVLASYGFVFLAFKQTEAAAEVRIIGWLLLAGSMLNLVGFVGLLVRPQWGRYCGYFSMFVMLFGFPIGTIFGGVGIYILSVQSDFFGADRITHKSLKLEFLGRKKAAKLAKKAAKKQAKLDKKAAKRAA